METLDHSKEKLDWVSGNITNPLFNELIATPANILIGVTNAASKRVAGQDYTKKVELKEVSQSQPDSAGFWVQTAVSGLCGAAVYTAAGKLTGGLSRELLVGQVEGLSRLEALDAASMSVVRSGLRDSASILAKEQVTQVAGASGDGKYRFSNYQGSGASWAEATNNALQPLHADLAKLLTARRQREQALKAADTKADQWLRKFKHVPAATSSARSAEVSSVHFEVD